MKNKIVIVISLIIVSGIIYWYFRFDIKHHFISKQVIFWKENVKLKPSDFQSEIDDCSIANTNLPLYSYYSFFKSPLSQFEKEKVNDYDAMELYKFKFFMIQLSEMNTRATEFLLKTLNDILNKN
jgi:hypothetical protein